MPKHTRIKPIRDYLYDKGEMIEQMFSSIPIVEIRNMVPIKLQGMPLHELKAECLVELLGMSDREITNIVDGKKERTLSSSDSDLEDVFVISDDERKIKKEKKDIVRRIKVERGSLKKDNVKKISPESGSSKKKRKSQVEVDLKSRKKKKKAVNKSASPIPSSSRECVTVPVGKKKKDEKKKHISKMKDEVEVVVLDDDSDREEKREQKSLLDLLELEMRARAIRSLLKKEEHSHSQKILSEYKDEPDDLIPIEIEPPQIELLSDSEDEKAVETKLRVNKCTGHAKDGIPSKMVNDLHNFEDQKNPSPPPIFGLKDDSNSESCIALETLTETLGDQKPVTHENDFKTIHEIKADDTPSVTHGSYEKASGEEYEIDLMTDGCVQDDCSLQSSGSDNLRTIHCDGSHSVASKTHSSKDSQEETTTGHFLVNEEPSVATAMDGSGIRENQVNPSQHSSLCSGYTEDEFDRKDVSGSLAEKDQIPLLFETECSRINVGSETPNDDSVEIAVAKSSVPVPMNTDCSVKFFGCDSNTPVASLRLSLQNDGGTSPRRSVKDKLRTQFEDEALDYDYNPVASFYRKQGEGVPCQSALTLSSAVDKKVLSTEITSIADCERMQNKQGANLESLRVEECCAVIKSKGPSIPSSPETEVNCVVSGSISQPLLEILADNLLVDNTAALHEHEDARINQQEIHTKNSHQGADISKDVYNLEVLKNITLGPATSSTTCDTKAIEYALPEKTGPPNEEVGTTHPGKEVHYPDNACETKNLNLELADYTKNSCSVESEVKEVGEVVYEADVQCPELLPIKPHAASTTKGKPPFSPCEPEVVNEVQGIRAFIIESTPVCVGKAEACAISAVDNDKNSENLISTNALDTGLCMELTDEHGQLPDETGTVKTSQLSTYHILDPLSQCEVVEIIDEGTHARESLEAKCLITCPSHETSRGSTNKDVAEVIDITGGEPFDEPEVVISEERLYSESFDGSDNEMGETALILEQMNNILTDDVADGADSDSSECSQLSSSGSTSEVSSIDGKESDSESDDEAEDDGQPKDQRTTYDGSVEVLEVDTDDENKFRSHEDVVSQSNDGTRCGGEITKDSISIYNVSSSSSSECSVESQQDILKSDDSVMLVHPNCSKSHDCMGETEAECSTASRCSTIIEPDGYESDDCAIVSETIIIDGFESSKCENAGAEVDGPIPPLIHSSSIKESAVVTIVIDDGAEEEVIIQTEERPVEIVELEDDDGKTNWTSRWLESDNVKNVVKTSKIWTNVRKQMKIKLKKSDSPLVGDYPNPSEVKAPPPLIGSVEEYHRLVKEGVICCKATENDEPTEDSNSSALAQSEVLGINGVTLKDDSKTIASQGSECNLDSKSIGFMLDRCEVDLGHRKKPEMKKSGKSERRKKSRKGSKDNSDFYKVPYSSKASSNQSIPPCEDENSNLDKKAFEEDVSRDFSGNKPTNVEQKNGVCKEKVSSGGDVFVEESHQDGGKIDRVSCKDQEEGETSEKEEGEISDSDDDINLKSNNTLQSSSSFETSTESKKFNRTEPRVATIPLPLKPLVKSKPPPTKPRDRNSAAKRFILRNLQLGKKKPLTSKKKKSRKKGSKKCSSYLEPTKNQAGSLPYVMPNESVQATPVIQAHPGLTELENAVGQVQSTNTINNTVQYDSYYSWAYSQGLINSASGNYGYGTPECAPDPNIYKQWEEYYRKLMEACKISAAHVSAGSSADLCSTKTAEKTGYTWVFDHSATGSQTAPVQAPADSTADSGIQVQAVDTPLEHGGADLIPAPVVNETDTDKDRFESWQYRFGLQGLLKEHFLPAPNACGNKQM